MEKINKKYLKKTICIPCDEFENIIQKIYKGNVEINYDLEDSGWSPLRTSGRDIKEEDVAKKLESYFDVKIESIHTDNYSPCNFWIVLKSAD